MNFDPSEIACVFADGGVIRSNPSTIGGTYGFVFVDAEGNHVYEEAGVVPCPEGRAITNNTTEQIAICKALEALPEGWSGILFSDSQTAISRVKKTNCSGANLPANVALRTRKAKARLGHIEFRHVPGIKVKKQLAAGLGSVHQYWCDRAAKAAGREYLEKLNMNNGKETKKIVGRFSETPMIGQEVVNLNRQTSFSPKYTVTKINRKTVHLETIDGFVNFIVTIRKESDHIVFGPKT